MRWGVRKRAPVKKSSDFKKTENLRNKKSSELSNKQLQQLNARQELERKHAQFNPGSFNKGHAAVRDMLAVGATATAIYAFARSPLAKHAASFVKSVAKNAKYARRVKNAGKWTWVDRTPLAIEAASRVVR